MKGNAWKNIDIECEEGMPSRKLSAIDGATKIMEKITPEMVVSRLTDAGRELIRQRLQRWIDAV